MCIRDSLNIVLMSSFVTHWNFEPYKTLSRSPHPLLAAFTSFLKFTQVSESQVTDYIFSDGRANHLGSVGYFPTIRHRIDMQYHQLALFNFLVDTCIMFTIFCYHTKILKNNYYFLKYPTHIYCHAVSYTHLDVYKRQINRCLLGCDFCV